MQESRFKYQDAVPLVRSAGVSTRPTDSAASCLRQDNSDGPGTPPHLKKYRKSHQNQPGIKQIHYGVFDDRPKVPEDHSFGKKFQGSDHVNEVIKAQNLDGLAARFNDIKESKYASNIREPLFKGYERKYAWPEQIENQ